MRVLRHWFALFSAVVCGVACGGTSDRAENPCPGTDVLCDETCCPGTCTENRCLVMIVSGGSPGIGALAIDARSVYWAADDSVMSIPLEGGMPLTLASEQRGVNGIAIDADHVYWTSFDGKAGESGDSIVMRAPLEGGTPTTLASFSITPGNLDRNSSGNWLTGGTRSIAVDVTSVYFAVEDVTPVPAVRRVMKVPLAGGTPTLIASNLGGQLGLDATNVYGFAPGPPFVEIGKAPVGGGSPTTLATTPTGTNKFSALIQGIAIDHFSAYWSAFDGDSKNGDTIAKVPLGGGASETLATVANGVSNLAVDATSVFFVDQDVYGSDRGVIMKVPTDGGKTTTLASGQGFPADIAVDQTSVYWTVSNEAGGIAVMKLTPK